jgi:hypothetical protein
MMTDKGWGPFGMGKWKGHEGVYCRVCGWPAWSAYVGDDPPPGICVEDKTAAIGCSTVIERLKMQAWIRAATGFKPFHPAQEMLRATTGLSWERIEAMCDRDKRGSTSIAEMKSRHFTAPEI